MTTMISTLSASVQPDTLKGRCQSDLHDYISARCGARFTWSRPNGRADQRLIRGNFGLAAAEPLAAIPGDLAADGIDELRVAFVQERRPPAGQVRRPARVRRRPHDRL